MLKYIPFIDARVVYLAHLPFNLPPGTRVLFDGNTYEIHLPSLNNQAFVLEALRNLPLGDVALFNRVTQYRDEEVKYREVSEIILQDPIEIFIDNICRPQGLNDLKRELLQAVSNPGEDKLSSLQTYLNEYDDVDLMAEYNLFIDQYYVDLKYFQRIAADNEIVRNGNRERRAEYDAYLARQAEHELDESDLRKRVESHFLNRIRVWGFARLYGL